MGLEDIHWELLILGLVHDLSIAVYIGGSVEFVLGPAQKAIPPAQAQIMGEKTADRFLRLVWVALILIVVTGLLRLEQRGWLVGDWPPTVPPLTWDFSYGRTVFSLLAIWGLLVVNGLVILFVLRPRLVGKMAAGTSSTGVAASQQAKLRAARWTQWITRADIALALLAALFGASLSLGGFV